MTRAHKPIQSKASGEAKGHVHGGRAARPLKPVGHVIKVRHVASDPPKATHTKPAAPAKPEKLVEVPLPASISSPQDLGALILELKAYAKWANHVNIKLRMHQKVTTDPPELTPAANELLHLHSWTNNGQPLDAEACEQLINRLNKIKTKAPTVNITLAAPATKQLKTTIVAWCRQNVDPGALVNFQFSASILGGMVVRYGSHMYDWSFRAKIMDNRAKFAEVLRRV